MNENRRCSVRRDTAMSNAPGSCRPLARVDWACGLIFEKSISRPALSTGTVTCALHPVRPELPGFCRCGHGLYDALVAGAAANDGGHRLANLHLCRTGHGDQEVQRRHQHAGCAETALQPMMLV